MIPPGTEVTATLAGFVAGCRWGDLPDVVRKEAKRSLVNFFASSFAGCNEPPIVKALATLRPFGAPGHASVIGRRDRVDAATAAFVNAMSANVFDFDDTHPATIIHPTAPVAAALFALAETHDGPREGASTGRLAGEDLLLAFALGAEAFCRIGNAVSPGHYRRGWHITSTCGVFGAALATGKALRLPQQQLVWSIGNAAVQTGGLVETLGTMSKSISVGNAARNGLLSALLARDGFSGPDHPLEGERGFVRIATDAPNVDAVTAGLGNTWELLTNTYKPYPCGVVLNPVLEACIAMSSDERLADEHARAGDLAAGIASVEIVGHPLLRERTDRPGVGTGRAAQVSAQHAVAVGLCRGKAGLDEFSDAAVADPALRAIGGKVHFVDDETYAVDAARVSIRMASGATLERLVEHAYGGPARPMTDADLERKLRDLAAHGGFGRDTAPLVDALWNLEHCADAADVVRLARRDAPASAAHARP